MRFGQDHDGELGFDEPPRPPGPPAEQVLKHLTPPRHT